jgi:hypothetical protein
VSTFLGKDQDIGVASNLTEIYVDYVDDGSLKLGLGRIINSIYGTTAFSAGATPDNLPGGNSIIPHFTANEDLSVDAGPPQSNGINESIDKLGIVYDVLSSTSLLKDIGAALLSGDLRIGLHVRAIGGITSDAYINGAPVPEPATMLLFGTGIVGLVGVIRKKQS